MRKTLGLRVVAIAALFLIRLGAFGQMSVSQHHIVVGSSLFEIYGKTNISSFECLLEVDYVDDTLQVETVAWSSSELSFAGLEMRYPVSQFKCALPPMTSELHETLNAGQYPELMLEVKDVTVLPGNSQIEKLHVGAHVALTLAGVKKDLLIEEGFIVNESGYSLVFGGREQLLLSDFGLEPPRKMFGLVKVQDEIEVSFSIALKTQPIK